MIQERLVEKDGRRGLLVAVQTAKQPDEWDGHELIRFATAVRRIELPGGEAVTTSGPSVIFADIVETVAHDGPRVTLVAGALLLVMVVQIVGFTRAALHGSAATVPGGPPTGVPSLCLPSPFMRPRAKRELLLRRARTTGMK